MSVSPDVISPASYRISRTSPRPGGIVTLLLQAARKYPHSGIRLLSSTRADDATLITYPSLLHEARRILGGLRSCGRLPGTNVALVLERPGDFIPAFWACVLGGYIPCPVAPIRHDSERWAKHISHIVQLLESPLLVTTDVLRNELPNGVVAANLDDLRGAKPHDSIHEAQPGDPAVLMLTSGSTGNSKAVVLTHGNLLASMAGKARRQRLTSSDVTLNWIAFDHVAALLEVHMVSQYVGAAQLHIEPAPILADPLLFLRIIDKHRVTLAFAPNFLLGQINSILRAAKPGASKLQLFDPDFSCLRYIVTGGEANVVETGRRFLAALAPYGLRRNVLRPAFGMTETSAASVYSHEFPDGDADREFAAVGLPIARFRMRIVDEDCGRLAAGQVGELQVRGPMVFRRYYNNHEATRSAFTRDGWFRTGDLARIENGRLSLVGRSKDSIIVSGVNYFSHELEAALEQLAGVQRSFVAAFPIRPRGADTEQLAIAFATSIPADDGARLHQLIVAIRSTAILLWGFRPAMILPLPQSAFPKTSLGKIQRALLRRKVESGEFATYQSQVATLLQLGMGAYVQPEGERETAVAAIFADLFGLDPREVSADASFFELGGTSLDIIKLKQRLEAQLGLRDLPLAHILQHPTIRALAGDTRREYDPIVPLQLTGSKTPLFCVHPGVGEILIYVGLASYFVNERPFYALRARGVNEGETYFESVDDMVRTYTAAIRRRQPQGPYAIAGYSFGGPIAFEIAKALEAEGEEVGFIGCIDETPFLAEPSSKLDGPEGPLHVAFLLELLDRKQLDELPALLRGPLAAEDPCDYIVQSASPERLAELDMDLPKFRSWAELSRSLVTLGQSYQPTGSVRSMSVFHAQPLHGSKAEWAADVRRWDQFTRWPSRYIEVAGEHHTIMGKQHVPTFQATLRAEIDRAMEGL